MSLSCVLAGALSIYTYRSIRMLLMAFNFKNAYKTNTKRIFLVKLQQFSCRIFLLCVSFYAFALSPSSNSNSDDAGDVTMERQNFCVCKHTHELKCGEDTKACKAIRKKTKSAKDEAGVCLQRNITLMQLYNLLYFTHKRLFVCVRLASLKSKKSERAHNG